MPTSRRRSHRCWPEISISASRRRRLRPRPRPALLGTSLKLFREQPALRRSCLCQFSLFAGFTAAWTSVALFLTSSHYGYGTAVVGVVALVGAGSVFAVPIVGRLIDRYGADAVSPFCFAGVAAAAVVLLGGELADNAAGLTALIVGLLLLDVGVQSSQVANQARIFALVEGARSRLNSVYMTAVFLGGSLGTWLGVQAYLRVGWPAVCGFVLLTAVVAGATHLLRPASPARRTAPPGTDARTDRGTSPAPGAPAADPR